MKSILDSENAMKRLSMISPSDVQRQLAATVKRRRKALKLSREALAETSAVPASTIKRFETTGRISLRQFILLWQCVDELERLAALCQAPEPVPRTIEEVLRG